jgi:sugar-specific transcriptional regulator TrmB
MKNKTTNQEKILKLLANLGPADAEEISSNLDISKNSTYVYLNRLKKENKIEELNNSYPHKYRAIDNLTLLKHLHQFMMEKMEPSAELSNEDIKLIKIIEERIKDVSNR